MAQKKARVRNAADREQVLQAKEQEQFSRDDQLNDVRQVLSTPEGRRFWWRWLGECGVHESVMSSDALAMAYQAGRQDVGHQLEIDVMDADPGLYLLMQREAYDRERKQIEPDQTEDSDA